LVWRNPLTLWPPLYLFPRPVSFFTP
jgi:hypothetical protein